MGAVNNKRPLISDSDTYITIGKEVKTVQDALNRIPVMLEHNYKIYIPDGNYSMEDIVIPSYMTSGINNNEGSAAHLIIIGNTAYPENVIIGSIIVLSSVGVSEPFINGLTIHHNSPYINEEYGIALFGTKNAQIYNIKFLPTVTYGIGAYEGSAKCKNIDVTNTNRGFSVKRRGNLEIYNITGRCYKLFTSQGGRIYFKDNHATYEIFINNKEMLTDTVIINGDNGKILTGHDIQNLTTT